MSLKHKVLECTITHWHGAFTGISALSVADKLGIAHEEVLKVFTELEKEGSGTQRTPVVLYQMLLSLDGPWEGDESRAVQTSIFFPARCLLEESFYSSGLNRRNLPEYKARLHKGHSQLDPFYFNAAVLKKYLEHPEVYTVQDRVSGGDIIRNPEYDNRLSDAAVEDVGFVDVRFGKRLLADNQTAVVAILKDLADLPDFEQSHWNSYEIRTPRFRSYDPDFDVFVRRDFEAEWVDDEDPLQDVLAHLARVNKLFHGTQLFQSTQNTYLAYPVENTYKDFCNSCSELYKLLGNDNLVVEALKTLLRDRFGYSDADFRHKESKRPLSSLQLLKRVADEVGASGLLDSIDDIGKHRHRSDHAILTAEVSGKNYVAEFRQICDHLRRQLGTFVGGLEKKAAE